MKKELELQALISIFQTAVELRTHEGELVWSRFSGYVVTHTIFLVIIGQIILNKAFPYRDFSLLITSFVGLMLTFLWYISTKRGFESVEFWSYRSIELAAQLNKLYKIPNIFFEGREYFKENREVKFDIGEGKIIPIQRSLTTQFFKLNTRQTAYLSIMLILCSYVIVFGALIAGFLK